MRERAEKPKFLSNEKYTVYYLSIFSLSAETNMKKVHTLFHLLVVRPHTQLLLRRRRVTMLVMIVRCSPLTLNTLTLTLQYTIRL